MKKYFSSWMWTLGKNLVRNFSELGALASICDPSTEIANKYTNEFNVENLSFGHYK